MEFHRQVGLAHVREMLAFGMLEPPILIWHPQISFGIFPAVKGRIPVTLIEVGIIVDKGDGRHREAERW